MTDQSSSALTMLQAIELFRVKQPAEWTEEDLAAFRARLAQSPALIATLGGQSNVDRRLAEIAAAQAAALLRPAACDASPATPEILPAPGRSRVRRRAVEAALILALSVGAGGWLYSLWPKAGPRAETVATNNSTQTKTPPAKSAQSQPADEADESAAETPSANEPEIDDHTWQGWTITGEQGAEWSLTDDWNLIEPSNPKPVKLLTIEGGPVILARRCKITQSDRFLEVNVRLLQSATQPGHIVIRVDESTVADATIGSGETKWPLYVSLEKWAEKEVLLQVVYSPGEAGQEIKYWDLALVATQRHEPRAESSLAESLASTDPKHRLYAALKAAKDGDVAAIPALRDAIHDKELHIRLAAVTALLKFDDPRAREALRAALERHHSSNVRKAIAGGLGRNPQPEDIPSLIEALKAPDRHLRKAAAKTLAKVPDASLTTQLLEMFKDSDRNTREAAAVALALRKGEAVEQALLPALSMDAGIAIQMPAACYFQANPTPRAIAPLAILLQSDDVLLRKQVVGSLQAIEALGRIPDEAVIDALGIAAKDNSPVVRRPATQILRKSRHPKAAVVLAQPRTPK